MKFEQLLESSRAGEKLYHSTMLWTMYNILNSGVLKGTQYEKSATGKIGDCAEPEICTMRETTFNRVAKSGKLFGQLSGSTGAAVFILTPEDIIAKERGVKIKPIGELPRDSSERLLRDLKEFGFSEPSKELKRISSLIVNKLKNIKSMEDHFSFMRKIISILNNDKSYKDKEKFVNSIAGDLATLLRFQSLKREGEERVIFSEKNKSKGLEVNKTKITFIPSKEAIDSEVEDWEYDYEDKKEKLEPIKKLEIIIQTLNSDRYKDIIIKDDKFRKTLELLNKKKEELSSKNVDNKKF